MYKGIIYILAFIVFLVSFLLLKKDNKTRNLILWIIIMFFITFIVNSLVIFILGIFDLPAPMLFRTLVFFGLSVYPLYKIIKTKKVQKYKICYIDYIALAVALFLTIGIGVWRFGNFHNLCFETTDPAIHYASAEILSESSKLPEKSNTQFLFGGAPMFFASSVTGTGFQIVDFFGGGFQERLICFYVVELLIIFSSFMIVFYSINQNIDKKNWKRILLSLIICILYILGYPLNNMIFGFHYLGLGILIGLILLKLVSETIDKDTNALYLIFISITAFSIFTCYYLFVPIFYATVGLYILYLWKFQKKFDFNKACKYIGICLFIPFAVGMYHYFIRSYIFSSGSSDVLSSNVSFLKLEGYIYRSLLGNFVLILPIVFYKIILNIKIKKTTIFDFGFISIFGLIVLIFILLYIGRAGSYYFYKLYYLLSPMVFILFGQALTEKNERINGFAVANVILLFSLFWFQFYDVDNELYDRNPLMNNSTFSRGIEDVYWFNNIKNDKDLFPYIYTSKQLSDLDKLNKKYHKQLIENKVIYYDYFIQKFWFHVFTGINPINNEKKLSYFVDLELSSEDINDSVTAKYLICTKSSKQNCVLDNFEIEYQNSSFVLTKRIND